jgi:hypothetical protein
VESLLERVSDACMAAIERLRVCGVQRSHEVGQVAARRVEQRVVVRAHQAAGIDTDLAVACGFAERRHERPPVVVGLDDRRFAVATRHHVVDRARKLHPVTPRHTSADGKRRAVR